MLVSFPRLIGSVHGDLDDFGWSYQSNPVHMHAPYRCVRCAGPGPRGASWQSRGSASSCLPALMPPLPELWGGDAVEGALPTHFGHAAAASGAVWGARIGEMPATLRGERRE